MMDSLFANFLAVMGRFFDEEITRLVDERAAAAVAKAREGLATQGSVDALAKQVADLSVSLPAMVKPLATKTDVDAAKAAAVREATNGRPNWTETNKRVGELLAPLAAKLAELEAKTGA